MEDEQKSPEETPEETTEVTPEPTPEEPTTPEVPNFEEQFSKLSEEIASIKETLNSKPEASLPPNDENFDPKDWNDVFSKVEELAEKKYQTIEQQKEEQRAAAQAEADRINAEFDRQLDTLAKEGKLPKISDPNDDNDPGVKASKELFALGVKYKSTDLIAMADLRDKLKKEPSGATAPVGSSSQTTENSQTSTYDPTKNLDQLVSEFKKNL